MTRNDAWALLREYTTNESLIKHALAVEAAMRHYAGLLGGNVDQWGLVGLLHDFDYERWPQPTMVWCTTLAVPNSCRALCRRTER